MSDARILDVRKIKIDPTLASDHEQNKPIGSPTNLGVTLSAPGTLQSTASLVCSLYPNDAANCPQTNPHQSPVVHDIYQKTVAVIGVNQPKNHILGRLDWIHDDGKFVSEYHVLAMKYCNQFLLSNPSKCMDQIIHQHAPYSNAHLNSTLRDNIIKSLWSLYSTPHNRFFYWSADAEVRKYMEFYNARARCNMDEIELGWSLSFMDGLNKEQQTISANPFFAEQKNAIHDRAAILFVPIEDFCLQGYGKIRLLIKSLGHQTIIRYFNCGNIKPNRKEISFTKVLQPYQVDWRPATKRQALYPGCCDVCYIWDHLKPCAFNCPDAYTNTIIAVILFSLLMAALVYFLVYCCFAIVENKRAGVPNWWCALPCFRLTVEEYTIEREVIEESYSSSDYGYND